MSKRKKYKVGDIITLQGNDQFGNVDCIVMKTHPLDGRILKLKAVIPDPRLAKIGFLEEHGEYVALEWDLCLN